jgi:zinc-ribbon domain
MYCPECGTENEVGNRYCVNCGAPLSKDADAAAHPSSRERVARLVGTTRRERLLSGATLVAVLVAVAAFVLLKPTDEGPGQDSFTRAADRNCANEKLRIKALERNIAEQPQPDIERFATGLVEIVEEWRLGLDASSAPTVHAAEARALDSALLHVLIEAGGLARVARAGNPKQVAAQAQLVDRASARVDAAADALGLDSCSTVRVSAGRS